MTIGIIDVYLSRDFEGARSEIALALCRAGEWSDSVGGFEVSGAQVVHRPALVRNPRPKPVATGAGALPRGACVSLEQLCEAIAPVLDAGFVRVSTTIFEDDEPVRISRLTLTAARSAYLEVHHPRAVPPRLRLEEWI